MENLIQKLNEIADEYKSIDNPTHEQLNEFKQKEFDLFGEITTIKELCEYYKCDMEIDKLPTSFINGMYSGVVNGSMFVTNEIIKVISENDFNEKEELINALNKKLEQIQGLS